MAIRTNETTKLINTITVLKTVSDAEKDGEEFINVALTGKTELGRFLSIMDNHMFNTFLGRTNSIKVFMEFLTVPDYPLEFLSRRKVTKEDLKDYLGKQAVSITNYWSLLAYALCSKIDAYKDIQEAMKKNTLKYTCIGKTQEHDLFGQYVVKTQQIRSDMVKYIAIVTLIEQLIKEDRFNKENIEKLCMDLRDDTTKDLLDGVVCLNKLNIVPKNQEAEPEKEQAAE